MEQYIIKGGNPLVGDVEISGAKNSALGILAAAIMCDETVTVRNLPDVNDIRVFLKAIESIGAMVRFPEKNNPHVVEINGKSIREFVVDNDYIHQIRASYYLIGAMLGKYKQACVALPGGCKIGTRPIDQHQKGFKLLGAKIRIENGLIYADAENDPETGKPALKGTKIYLDVVSVGATINVMLAASMAEGRTVIENAAKEPHVVDVAQFLNQMGADVRGAGTDRIRINGVPRFHSADHEIIPDQIEAGTYMCAAAATGGDVTIRHIIPTHLESIVSKLKEMDVKVEKVGDDAIRVWRDGKMTSASIKTQPHPGFPTDMQSQFAACLALAEGTSTVTEKIFENRFQYIDELTKMGAHIVVESSTAIISGVNKLTGATVAASDLRAGAALVIAGLAAEGTTYVKDIHYIQRGYENFESKIRRLGGMISRVDSDLKERNRIS